MASKKTVEVEEKVVVFTGEAAKPKKLQSGVLGLRSPLPLTIPERKEMTIDLGTTCDKWLFVLPHKDLFPKVDGAVIAPGKSVKVTVFNNSHAPIFVEVGEIVLEAVILDNSDFTVK